MKNKIRILLAVFALHSALVSQLSTALAQGTAFTYQGRLAESGTPANGVYDLQFRLLASTNALSLPIGTLAVEDTGVTNGLFTVALGFGANAFDGNPRWLEISVRPGASGGAYTNLAPLQLVTATPYAIRALQVGTNGLAAGAYANAVSFHNPGNSFTGNGTGLTNVSATTLGGLGTANFWQTGGNGGTTPGAQFLGTTDNQPLELKVNGARALRLEPTAGAPNVIGGAANNQITAPSAGGGVLSGSGHRIFNASDYSVIAGGFSNRIQISSPGGFIGGGQFNWIVNSSTNSVIGGGAFNQITDPHSFIGGGMQQTNRSSFAFIGGGKQNRIEVDSEFSTIGGGNTNTIATNSQYATIGGGVNNIASDRYATVPGGRGNIASGFGSTAMGDSSRASGAFSTALGSTTASADYSTAMGFGNKASARYATAMGYLSEASGDNSTAMGSGTASGSGSTAMGGSTASGDVSTAMGTVTTASGYASTAMGRQTTASGNSSIAMGLETTAGGDYSTAMGRRANAIHSGSFVWADDQNADFFSLGANQFALRASGGVRFSDDTPHLSFGSSTREMIRLYGSDYTIGVQSSCLYQRSNADFSWFQAGVHSDTRNSPGVGGVEMMRLRTTGLTVNGAFLGASDRNLKENFKPVDPRDVLDKVAALPLSEWNYKADTASRHLGPMAQDFYAAFGVGPDDKHIATVDADGVALAAIQGLNQKVEATRAENVELKRELSEIKQLLLKLSEKKD